MARCSAVQVHVEDICFCAKESRNLSIAEACTDCVCGHLLLDKMKTSATRACNRNICDYSQAADHKEKK